MITGGLPWRISGYLIPGEPRDVVIVADGGWPSTPTLHLGVGAASADLVADVVDGEQARWTLSSTLVDELVAAGHGANILVQVTVGGGQQLRTLAAGWLLVVAAGLADETRGDIRARLIIGPPGPAGEGADQATIMTAVADYLAAHPVELVADVDVIILAPDATPTGGLVDGVLTLGIPQGPAGEDGRPGDTGHKGDKGDPGEPGATTIAGIEGLAEELESKQTAGDYLTADTLPAGVAAYLAAHPPLTPDPAHPGLYLIGETP